jgi:acetylornithine/N-succinyldiaminopimelate aminotransferase
MMELIQGEGGVLPLDKEFVQDVAAYCQANEPLAAHRRGADRRRRTGTLFCFEQYGIAPDAVSFAKGIAGGCRSAGFSFSESCAGVLSAGTHASTFGGNPVCSAGALAVLDQLSPNFSAKSRQGSVHPKRNPKMNLPCVNKACAGWG